MRDTLHKSKFITPQLILKLRSIFALNWKGSHGAAHWARVRLNGLILADMNGADKAVIEYFAFLHDLRREDEGLDPGHGPRAAEFANRELRQEIDLDDVQFKLLTFAMEGHTVGTQHQNITIATCWDADRLDLGRCGIYPDPLRLCTKEGKRQEIISAAWDRSEAWLKSARPN
jgi:uncharacterized protein